MLNNFTKYFSGAGVNQIVSKDLNGESSCTNNLSFSASLQNFYSIKKLMMLEIADKYVFETMKTTNNLVSICDQVLASSKWLQRLKAGEPWPLEKTIKFFEKLSLTELK